MRTLFSKASAASLFGLLVLAACSSPQQPKFQTEQFDTGASPFAHNFNANTADTCEAARRALLSQGYMTTLTHPDTVDGSKNFQPNGDSHIVVEFHVVCTPGEETGDTSIVYVNAVQNGFALKKSDTSASVGLSVLGSVSLPIRSNNDALVKISSETIPSGKFYDRFFALVDHYLQTVVRTMPVKSGDVVSMPLPMPAPVPAPATVSATEPPAPAPAPVLTTATVPVAAAQPGALNVPAQIPAVSSASGNATAPVEPEMLGRPDTTPAVSSTGVSP